MRERKSPFIVGLIGGIASGKSFWAKRFGECGCLVVDADALVTEVYLRGEVTKQLRAWWGDGVVNVNGTVNRQAVARVIFSDAEERVKLEKLIHPQVAELREALTAGAAKLLKRAVVWDIPLLVEVGLKDECDRVVFVEAPKALREKRAAGRGWSVAELAKREAAQLPVAEKRAMADEVLGGEGDVSEEEGRRRVEELLGNWGV